MFSVVTVPEATGVKVKGQGSPTLHGAVMHNEEMSSILHGEGGFFAQF